MSINIVLSGKSDSETVACKLTHHFREQHTIEWRVVGIDTDDELVLPSGSCNLYRYPDVLPLGVLSNGAEPLEGAALHELNRLIVGLAIDEPSFMEVADGSGALPFLGLLVANTDAAVALALAIFEARPELLPLAHIERSPFEGENSLHVLAN